MTIKSGLPLIEGAFTDFHFPWVGLCCLDQDELRHYGMLGIYGASFMNSLERKNVNRLWNENRV
ncbi:uncharacterized protein LOC111117948 [Crassostrea virginica]